MGIVRLWACRHSRKSSLPIKYTQYRPTYFRERANRRNDLPSWLSSGGLMAVRIVPYTEREEPAAQAFNQRMRERNAASEFLLPERAPQLPAGQAIPAFYHL